MAPASQVDRTIKTAVAALSGISAAARCCRRATDSVVTKPSPDQAATDYVPVRLLLERSTGPAMKLAFSITLMMVVLVMAGAVATAPQFRPVHELGGRAAISAAYVAELPSR